MKATPAQAREEWPCPLARTFDKKIGPNCDADHCPMWRWIALSSSDPKFVSAVKKEQRRLADEEGRKNNGGLHKIAVKNVMADRPAHNVPEKPTHGYCGIAGKPAEEV